MINARLEKTDGEVIKFQLPEKLEEVTIKQKINFDLANEALIKWLSKHLEEQTLYHNRVHYLYHLCNVVAEVIDVPLKEVLRCDVSQYLDESGDLDIDVFNSQFDTEKVIHIDSATSTLLTVYNHLTDLILSYKPKTTNEDTYTFEYKGETYQVPYVYSQTYLGQPVYSKIDVQQAVEILEIKRWAAGIDDSGNTRLTHFLGVLSLLARKVEEDTMEELPNKIDIFIKKRSLHFQDIPFPIALNAVFFSMPTIFF